VNFAIFGRHRARFGAGLLAFTGIALLVVAALRVITNAVRQIARIAVPTGGRYLRWFWRLSIGAKVGATVAEVIVLQLAMPFVPGGALERHELMDGMSVGLLGLLLVGILFGATGARTR
jgi:hypothetical protein